MVSIKAMFRLILCTLVIGMVATVEGQSPPLLLQIVTERLRAGVEKDYGRIEGELRDACRRLGAPNRYLALVSINRPTEVWWLNMYDSQAAVARVAEAYSTNTTLLTALRELSAKKHGMTEPPLDRMTKFRSDLSSADPWRIGELQYTVVRELHTPAKSVGAVFQSPDGRAFVLIAASDRDNAEQQAERLGEGARIFEVQPKWSLPQETWVSLNPRLWSP